MSNRDCDDCLRVSRVFREQERWHVIDLILVLVVALAVGIVIGWLGGDLIRPL